MARALSGIAAGPRADRARSRETYKVGADGALDLQHICRRRARDDRPRQRDPSRSDQARPPSRCRRGQAAARRSCASKSRRSAIASRCAPIYPRTSAAAALSAERRLHDHRSVNAAVVGQDDLRRRRRSPACAAKCAPKPSAAMSTSIATPNLARRQDRLRRRARARHQRADTLTLGTVSGIGDRHGTQGAGARSRQRQRRRAAVRTSRSSG